MNSFRIPLTLLLLAAGTMVCGAITLKELEASYDSKCSEITLEKDKSLKSLRDGYITALGRIEAKYRKAGNLDAVLLVKEEAVLIEGGKWPLPALPEKISMEANSPRKIFLRNYLKIEQDAAKDLVDTADKMLALLESQVVELTKSGDITEAQLAQQISNDIVKDADITGARKLLANVLADGKSRPALRIRRYGDNIEVIVRYDMRGKVSMDSPISNVKEADKSIGDTKAKVLGEFVGAEGYEPQSVVLYDQVFNGGAMENFALRGIEATFGAKEAGEIGVRLSYDINSTNPNGSIGGVLPLPANPGTIRISCRYFLPSSNKVVKGFHFTGGNYTPIGNRILEKKGKWTDDSVTGPATDETGRLRFYIKGTGKADIPKSRGDYVLLQKLRIEQVSFTAYVTQRFDAGGVPQAKINEADKQPKFAENGVILPQPEP